MTREDVIQLVINIINGDVSDCLEESKEPHRFAEMVFAKSADDQAGYIGAQRIRETQQQKEQRMRLTNPITAAAISPALAYVEELRRTDGVTRQPSFASPDRLAVIQENFQNYYAGQTLENFLFDAIKMANEYDPNSWIVFERTPPQANGLYRMYPVLVESERAVKWHFNEVGELEYFAFSESDYISKQVTDGAENIQHVNHFYLYCAGFAAFAQCVNDDSELRYDEDFFTVPEAENYVIWVFETGTLETPAERLGAYLSELDANEPCELLYEAARGYLKDLMRLKSSHDLNELLHMYPKLFQYVKRCTGVDVESGAGCEAGYYGGDHSRVCRSCNGTGKIIHGSEQDNVTLAFPESKEEFVDLAQVAHYMALPMEVFTNQQQRLEYLSTVITFVIYSQEQTERIQPGVTATEIAINYNRIYNKLAPIAHKWGQCEAKAYRIAMQYYGAFSEGDNYFVQFPSDFAMKTENELIKDLGEAKANGAPYAVVKAIGTDLLKKKYRDNQSYVADQLAFDALKPFADKGAEEIALILSSRSKDDPKRVMWENWQEIQTNVLDGLESGLFAKMPLATKKQRIAEQVTTIIAEMPKQVDATLFNPVFNNQLQ